MIALPPSVTAQNAQGTILGHITDPSGIPVSGAKVTIQNASTNVTQSTSTNDLGDYVFVDVEPGTYDIRAEESGFRTARGQGLILEVEHTLRQDFSFTIGPVAESVSVRSDAQMAETDNAALGNVISQTILEELPISGRDFTNLLRLQTGATTTGGGVSWAWTMHGFNSDWLSTSINGSRSESNSFLVDGINSNDEFFSANRHCHPRAPFPNSRYRPGRIRRSTDRGPYRPTSRSNQEGINITAKLMTTCRTASSNPAAR